MRLDDKMHALHQTTFDKDLRAGTKIAEIGSAGTPSHERGVVRLPPGSWTSGDSVPATLHATFASVAA